MINFYTESEIETLAVSGKILSDVLHAVAEMVKPGVDISELDKAAEQMIRDRGGEPAFKGFHEKGSPPFPASLCVSVNDELVHCIPYKGAKLQEGDVVNLDLGVRYKGMITDMAMTVGAGKISKEAARLIDGTKGSLEQGLSVLHPGLKLGDLGYEIQKYAEERGLAVVRDLVGHGVGKGLHEEPRIPNFGKPGTGIAVEPGMVLAIEPMCTLGSHKIKTLTDGWGISTADGSLAAHFEKTVTITKDGVRILTP